MIINNVGRYSFLAFTMIISIFGYFKLQNSVETGKNSARDYLSKIDGMNSVEYSKLTEWFITSEVLLGSVLLLIGLIFFCMCMYRFTKHH
ncbi:hypothetical protein N783_09655 [Pontibacillus marinus BH030004 = DSM 16465]|uniref:Uncharacterized protein n=1 Tax=Pontibacillus marinus BH030004 = DSM 16465 TaxID=1385511 RepID=A0A0A5G914_9BACI|nr:hypothetical protein N783_09655 [Pontibacillus marinus BH030004 = DSM 16465]